MPSMTIGVLVDADWTPQTREQREAVERLGRQGGGALALSDPDGTAEVLVVERGVYKRYIVQEDGSAEIAESRPRDWRWPLSLALTVAFLVFGFGIPILLIVLDRAGVLKADPWAAFSVLIGMILFVAALVVSPSPYQLKRHDDEREWVEVAWPED
jgi:hypothetical protein